MKEIWKDIPEYVGQYQASNLGKIKSLKFNKEFILKYKYKENGYAVLVLCKYGKRRNKYIHRLILEAFYGKSDLDCNHKNGIKTDNRLENLEYCTRSENIKHAYRIGLSKSYNRKGINHPGCKVTESEVKMFRYIYLNLIIDKNTWNKIAEAFGLKFSGIYSIIHNATWRHI